MKTFTESAWTWVIEERLFIKFGFDGIATSFGKFGAGGFAALENFDAIINIRVMRSSDIDGKIKAHLMETIIDARSWKYVDGGIFNA